MSRYAWDDAKAAANLRKHGVSFEEAATVVEDPLHRSSRDLRHAPSDVRLVVVGHSDQGRLLIVVLSERGPRPRIISARRATKRERHAYEARP
jgi:Uncharacterized protein conserved in bacteria